MSFNNQSTPTRTTQGDTPAPHNGLVNINPVKRGKLLRLPAVEERTALKKSTIYAGIKAGTFPPQVHLSARAVGFYEEDIDRWVSERVNGGGAK